jgi:morphogenetic protein associated with SpoVID
MPVAPKLPKLKPIAPEIDINNYYTVNMAMQAPKKEAPKELPKHESPESPEMESIEMPPQMPCYPIMPISPVMPGYGFNYMPCHPPMYAPQPYPMPMYQQAPMYHHGYENESFEEHAMGAHMAPMPMYPMMPHSCYGPVQCSPCPPPWGYQQPVYPAYHQAPMYPQVQGAMTGGHYESSSDGFGNAPYHYGQQYAPQQQGDCGCGEPRPDDYAPQQPYPQYQQQVPYGFQDPRAPYLAPYGMIGVPSYPAFDPNAFSIPEYDEYDEDED